MKNIIMLGLLGIFLAAFVFVLKGRERTDLNMGKLFNESAPVVGTVQEEKGAQSPIEKTVIEKGTVIAATLEKSLPENSPALRNEEIRRALKIEPRSAAREEVKRVLSQYREEVKGYERGSQRRDVYERRDHGDWREKRHDDDDHEEEDDD